MRRTNQAIALIALLSCAWISVHAAEESNWQVTQGVDKLSQQSMCLLESVSQKINDGRTITPIRIIYNGKAFLVLTHSKVDLSYPQLGLHIDKKSVHNIDRVYKQTNAVFANDADDIRRQFLKGRVAYISLGFWPSWPKSHTVVTRFSLKGFHAAYTDYLTCLSSHPTTDKQK